MYIYTCEHMYVSTRPGPGGAGEVEEHGPRGAGEVEEHGPRGAGGGS